MIHVRIMRYRSKKMKAAFDWTVHTFDRMEDKSFTKLSKLN